MSRVSVSPSETGRWTPTADGGLCSILNYNRTIRSSFFEVNVVFQATSSRSVAQMIWGDVISSISEVDFSLVGTAAGGLCN